MVMDLVVDMDVDNDHMDMDLFKAVFLTTCFLTIWHMVAWITRP